MTERNRIIRLSIFYFVIIVLVSFALPREINWTPSFSKNHSWPYGTKVLRTILQDAFPNAEISDNTRPIYNEVRHREDKSTLIILDEFFRPDTLELNSLMEYVSKGNIAFLSANSFSGDLLDTLKLELETIFDPIVEQDWNTNIANYQTNFFHNKIRRDSAYNFEMEPFAKYILNLDTTESITGLTWIDSLSQFSLVKKNVGEGFIFLHTNPYLLTNYHLLTDSGKSYVEGLLSHLPEYNIIWDEYYKEINQRYAASPMNVVLKRPPLRWAYWLSVIAIFVVLLFLTKRKQRVIPVMKPYRNDSVDFTKTIGQLYYNNADNRSLAMKKINILKEYLHTRYQMSNIKFSKDEIQYILKRSDLEEGTLMKLWETIWNIQDADVVYNGRLKVMNKLINKVMQKA